MSPIHGGADVWRPIRCSYPRVHARAAVAGLSCTIGVALEMAGRVSLRGIFG
jgi:hypothetical protein